MFLGDFHVHSDWSDGFLNIPDLVDFYGQRGFGAIAITDHLCETTTVCGKTAYFLGKSLTRDRFGDYLKLIEQQAERAWHRYKMVVLPGVEITKNSLSNQRSAHIVALNVTQWISADQDIVEILADIRQQGAFSIAAHPVWTGKLEPQTFHLWSRREEFATLFDAWEVASGGRLFSEVVKTKLRKIANSDLHHPRQMDSWKTQLFCERHPEAIFNAIRKQDLEFQFYQSPSHDFRLSRLKSLDANYR
jgi:hypothetical protein